MHRYLVIIEKAKKNYSAYSPDLPGCVATGATRKQAEANMTEAMQMHLKGMKEDKKIIPKPIAVAEYLAVR